MAALFTIPENMSQIHILDAGAGSGILSCAILERLEQVESIQTIKLTCYESDANILESCLLSFRFLRYILLFIYLIFILFPGSRFHPSLKRRLFRGNYLPRQPFH